MEPELDELDEPEEPEDVEELEPELEPPEELEPELEPDPEVDPDLPDEEATPLLAPLDVPAPPSACWLEEPSLEDEQAAISVAMRAVGRPRCIRFRMYAPYACDVPGAPRREFAGTIQVGLSSASGQCRLADDCLGKPPAGPHGVPTKVTTLMASSVTVAREPDTLTLESWARLSFAEVS